MSDRRPLASGDVLAHRYELQDLVSEKLGSTTWRAHDQILNRNVGIEMLASTDPRADHFLIAAKDSTAVTDPRFLRVLDLIEQPQERLGLDVKHRTPVGLAGDSVVALKEKVVEVFDGLLACTVPRPVEHLVEVLRGAVVTRVLRIAEAVREAV